MKYHLRNFDNNFQILNSTGWVFIVISLIFLIIKQNPAILVVAFFGAAMIWLQLRGKRIQVDTTAKTVRFSGKVHQITNPVQLHMNEVAMSQQVNSRASSARVKTFFYKAYLQDGEEKILLSSNRKESRDEKALAAIANELKIDFVKNY